MTATDGQLTGSANVQVTVNPSIYPAAADWANANTTQCGNTSATNPTDPTGWQSATPASVGIDGNLLQKAGQYSWGEAQKYKTQPYAFNESAYVIRYGYLVNCWSNGQQASFQQSPGQLANDFTRYQMESTTKSMGGLALMLALDDGKVKPDLSDNVSASLPANNNAAFGSDPVIDTSRAPSGAALNQITVFQLATHTSGLSKPEYAVNDSTPGHVRTLDFIPGSEWSYSDQGLNWLADVLTVKYGEDLWSLLNTRIYNPIGIDIGNQNDLIWRNSQNRTNPIAISGVTGLVQRRELNAGISATVNAMARVGLLMLRNGQWTGAPSGGLVHSADIQQFTTPPPQIAGASSPIPVNQQNLAFTDPVHNYGILWWTNANCAMPYVPKDTYFSWGLYENLIVVIPSLDLVVAHAGNFAWQPADGTYNYWDGNYARIQPFIQAVVASVTDHTVGQDCSVH